MQDFAFGVQTSISLPWSGWSPAAKRIIVNFEVKKKHFKVYNVRYTGCSRKTAQSFKRDKYGTVRRRMKIFAPKYLS